MEWPSLFKKKPSSLAVTDRNMNAVSPLNDYNAAIFGWLNNNQPLYYDDKSRTYVEEGYSGTPDIYVCINKILTKLAMCPPILYEVSTNDIQMIQKYKNLRQSTDFKAQLQAKIIELKALKKVYQSDISGMLYQPNPYETWTEWVKNWGGFKLITGNAYNYLNGPNPDAQRWSEMYVLPSHFIEIVSGGPWEPVKGYRLIGQGHYYQSQNIAFTANQVVHSKTFNPNYMSVGSQLYGMSPLKPFLVTMFKNRMARHELAKQMKNGGVMGFVSPSKDGMPLNPNQKDDLKEQLKFAKKGDDLQHRLFVANGPLSWQQIGLPSVELQILESIEFDQKDICNCYNVPIQLMNSQEASTDNNMDWAMKQFIYNAIMPEASELGDMLTRSLCAPLNKRAHSTGKHYEIIIDTSSLPEMQDDMQKVAAWLAQSDQLTYNEKREVMGYSKLSVPGADDLFISSNMILLKDAATTDAEITAPKKPGPNKPAPKNDPEDDNGNNPEDPEPEL